MARLASEEKAGFYPTPETQVELTARRLRVEQDVTLNMLDPCAGKGDALKQFAESLKEQGAKVITYGIELEKSRALEAQAKLDHVIYSPYEEARVTPLAFSFLWLNPPYTEWGIERAEVKFLRDLTDGVSGKLQPGGLLGYCIPQKVLAKAAMLLALRFENIRVYRFTDPDYGVYGQIVVFGYRRSKRGEDPYAERERLERLAYAELPPFDVGDGVFFTIPPADKKVLTFQANVLTFEEAVKAFQESPLWDEIKQHEPRPKAVLKRPVLPLKPTHIAVALAAGAVGGALGDHIIVGTTKRVTIKDEVTDEDGTKIIERQESRSIVRLFNQNGIHVLE